ncbi:MAG: hypothetical protein A3D37_01145 [Candidatus Zambryskibacteria bacterium RIFCSPHIGHO2_02_FULL_38_22]|nr:MAG: hypothetical protein A3D37_01145 [Candidatus Zambryskibacteria bacterium RIFCSPHIGHO2_02_FULL_38_22]
MNNFIKNFLLLVTVLMLSYFIAPYSGSLYDNFIPGSLGGGAWIGTTKAWQSIIGFPFAYIFFVILLFKLFGSGNKNKWTIWLLVPALLFFGSGDLKHIYLPIILGAVAFLLAKLVLFIISKFKHPNPPMVVK